MTTQNKKAPDWDAINLPDEHRQHLKQLQDDQSKLRRISVVANAIIVYMASDYYADTQGDDLQYAFHLLCEMEEA